MIVIECRRCTEVLGVTVEHRLPNPAVREIMRHAQNGELSTIKNHTVCLHTLYGDGASESLLLAKSS